MTCATVARYGTGLQSVTLDWVTKTAFATRRGVQWSSMTSLEDLDFANDLALLSHTIQDMGDKTRALEQRWA